MTDRDNLAKDQSRLREKIKVGVWKFDLFEYLSSIDSEISEEDIDDEEDT